MSRTHYWHLRVRVIVALIVAPWHTTGRQIPGHFPSRFYLFSHALMGRACKNKHSCE
jgi:hypothetical protein